MSERFAHEHNYQGQTLRHAHPGGREPHGYYGHPEDRVPDGAIDHSGCLLATWSHRTHNHEGVPGAWLFGTELAGGLFTYGPLICAGTIRPEGHAADLGAARDAALRYSRVTGLIVVVTEHPKSMHILAAYEEGEGISLDRAAAVSRGGYAAAPDGNG